jgi:uncharacterized protein YbaA (DUF1428 family)
MAKKGGYVDGFVFVVPTKNLAMYKKMAKDGKRFWMKNGAVDYYECVGDDVSPKMQPGWKHRTFMGLSGAKKNETVWFSFIVFKSKKHRDQVNAKVMKEMDTYYAGKEMPMPFDMKRFTYGGFKVEVN